MSFKDKLFLSVFKINMKMSWIKFLMMAAILSLFIALLIDTGSEYFWTAYNYEPVENVKSGGIDINIYGVFKILFKRITFWYIWSFISLIVIRLAISLFRNSDSNIT